MLGSLNYETRISLNNGVAAGKPYATEMVASLSVYDNEGGHLATTGELARLEPGGIEKLYVNKILDGMGIAGGRDLLGVVHSVPAAMVGTDAADFEIGELMAHTRVSDDFVEFHQKDGPVITGVAYQTGPLNDKRMSSTRSTVCQAPKVIVSEPVDTLMCLINASTALDYADTVRMDYWILSPDGERVARSHVEVPPWSFRLVSATQTLAEAGRLESFRAGGGLGMFLGYSKNGTLVPLSFTRNKQSGAIACDHTLPPMFYLTTWGGERRLEANAKLEQEFFADVAAPAPAEGVAA
jgi:hypothetical protein